MNCPDCGCEFSEDEAVPVHGVNGHGNSGKLIAHECPACGRRLSTRFTRNKNIENCPHNATVDNQYDGETCSQCGCIFDLNWQKVGIKGAWAIPNDNQVEKMQED